MKHINPLMLPDDERIGQNFSLEFVNISRDLGRYEDSFREVEKIVDISKIVPGARILDVPCGVGRHSGLLSKMGYNVTAVDLSATQIERAKRENPGPDYVCADMRSLHTLGENEFDLAINIYSSFGYNTSVEVDWDFLVRIQSLLRPGGHFIMELSDMKRARARLGPHTLPWRRNESEEVDFDWDSQTLFVRYFYEEIEKSHVNMRIYSEEQLMSLLFRASFRSVEFSRGLYLDKEDEPNTLFVHAQK